ncbi:MAG: calcium/sodium antiporter [Pseudomonadota bacterium]
MLIDSSMVLVGFVLLIVGADFLVRGAVAVARWIGVSPLVIGLTVVAFGTSLPELVVSLRAALGDAQGLALGNIVGSNVANILLILGVAALIFPIRCTRTALVRDGSAMMAATVFFAVAAVLGGFGLIYGVTALICLLGLMLYSYFSDKKTGETLHTLEAEEVEPIEGGGVFAAIAVVGGLAAVIIGGELLVEGAVSIARELHVSDEVIGLTLVAFGTSVPELATTAVAAVRRQADIALGNVLGSNLFNLLGVLGVTSVTTWLPTPPTTASFDVWVLLGVSLLLLVFMRTGWRLGRPEAVVLLVLYVGFILAQFHGVGPMMVHELGG